MSASSARLPPVQLCVDKHESSVIQLIFSTETYERLKPSGAINLFSMNRLARGPIAADTTERKHSVSKVEQERICEIQAEDVLKN